jgi:hypothetical protein
MKMEYKTVEGSVYSRYALTPPVINSDLALKYGLRVPSTIEPGQYSQLEAGRNVKLRLVVNDGKTKMTCHGRIDWVGKDETTGQTYVHFGCLSLTDHEFEVLAWNFVEKVDKPLEFGVRVRDYGKEAETVRFDNDAKEITRMAAVAFPLSVYEAIDEKRGAVPFSEFVANVLKENLNL